MRSVRRWFTSTTRVKPIKAVRVPQIVKAMQEIYKSKGTMFYDIEEKVSQIEHAKQTFYKARSWYQQHGKRHRVDHAGLVVAAAWHDVYHLIPDTPLNPSDGVDDCHETFGAKFLKERFQLPWQVTEPVELHVAAKRMLCILEPHYFQKLSTASQTSLMLQGGSMTTQEIQAFVAHRSFVPAIMLRKWDDQAKVSPPKESDDVSWMDDLIPFVELCVE